MDTTTNTSTARKMDLEALKVYVGGAAVVYTLALTYCYFTDHFMEMAIVGGVMGGLALLIGSIYRSLTAAK